MAGNTRKLQFWRLLLSLTLLRRTSSVRYMIATADGLLMGIATDGTVRWEQSLAPLITTSQHSEDSNLLVVPHLDGRVFLYQDDLEYRAVLEELLAKVPFFQDGYLYTGEKHTQLLGIDVSTGTIVNQDEPNVLWIGRVDSELSIHHQTTKYTVTHAQLKSVPDMHHPPRRTIGDGQVPRLLTTPSGKARIGNTKLPELSQPIVFGMDVATQERLAIVRVAEANSIVAHEASDSTVMAKFPNGNIYAMDIIASDVAVDAEETSLVVPPSYETNYYAHHHQEEPTIKKRKRIPKFWRVLGSWLPPLIALVFVSSFELGRRNKLQNQMDETEVPQHIQIEHNTILGHGGGGTVVFAGHLHGRPVAVKRMLQTHAQNVSREIALLIESDGHPNVVRYFLTETRGAFVYLALELCDLSLHDLIQEVPATEIVPDLLAQITAGVTHLHRLRIVHRDLKPANILLQQQDGTYTAKISDMGLGKQLAGHSSYGGPRVGDPSSTIGPGSVGWQAPEVMRSSDVSEGSGSPEPVRTSRSADIFSLGCIFYATLIPGAHPFGEWYEREGNIVHNRPRLEELRRYPEAHDLVSKMLRRTPIDRPTAQQVGEHPFFWDLGRRLAFLCDVSDRLETDPMSTAILRIERSASSVVGNAWDAVLDSDLNNNVQKFRSYDPSSVRDLLRLIRNKHHHFEELPVELRNSIGSKTEGLMKYFELRFPNLLIHCYRVCQDLYCQDDPLSLKYAIPMDDDKSVAIPECATVETVPQPEPELLEPVPEEPTAEDELVIWHGSTAASTFNNRGWNRAGWEKNTTKKRETLPIYRFVNDEKYRTRLCNHWDESGGTSCPMKRKGKCIFAHGPVELRVKEGKHNRWGKLVDKNGDNTNPRHSGGEDTYGLARKIETERLSGKKPGNKWKSRNQQKQPHSRRTVALTS